LLLSAPAKATANAYKIYFTTDDKIYATSYSARFLRCGTAQLEQAAKYLIVLTTGLWESFMRL